MHFKEKWPMPSFTLEKWLDDLWNYGDYFGIRFKYQHINTSSIDNLFAESVGLMLSIIYIEHRVVRVFIVVVYFKLSS